MKTINKKVLKQGYYYEEKEWYGLLPQKLTVPEYKTEIFPKDMSNKEIIETYKVEPYKNIEDAFAVAANCISTLKNDYKGRLVYFMDDDIRCRLSVWRRVDGGLDVYVNGVDLDCRWRAGRGVLFSNSTSEPLNSSNSLSLENFNVDTSEEDKQMIAVLKAKGYKITKERTVIDEY